MTNSRLEVGLIVDWGGVLTSPVDHSFAAFVQREQIDPVRFASAMRRMHDEAGSPLHEVEVGNLRPTVFEEELASQLNTTDGSPVSSGGLLERMFRELTPNASMRSIVSSARERGWRTAILSNAWGLPYDEPDLKTVVDTVLLSDRIHLRKPDPAAYLHAAATIGLPPQACVFVDDLRRNALAAENVGMLGLQYRGVNERKFEKLLELIEARATISAE